MELRAKLIQLLPLQTGQGKNGQWKKQDIIVETEGQYPKKVCISIWGDKINDETLKIGSTIDISFDVESREFNGKWYTDVKAWKVEPMRQAGSSAQSSAQYPTFTPPSPSDEPFIPTDGSSDDLPF